MGWWSIISSGVSLLAGWLPDQVGRDLFGRAVDVCFAGLMRPEGVALMVPRAALGRLPPQIVGALDQAGLLQLSLPPPMGDRETDPLTSFLAIEPLSKADGSMGWSTFISSGVSLLSGWLPAQVGRDLFGRAADVCCAGLMRPEGVALMVPGGYRLRGR